MGNLLWGHSLTLNPGRHSALPLIGGCSASTLTARSFLGPCDLATVQRRFQVNAISANHHQPVLREPLALSEHGAAAALEVVLADVTERILYPLDDAQIADLERELTAPRH